MEVRQSSILRLASALAQALQGLPDPLVGNRNARVTTDLMFSTYQGKKCATIASMDTGAVLLICRPEPVGPVSVKLLCMKAAWCVTDVCWQANLSNDIITKSVPELAVFVLGFFSSVNYLDDQKEFRKKIKAIRLEDVTRRQLFDGVGEFVDFDFNQFVI